MVWPGPCSRPRVPRKKRCAWPRGPRVYPLAAYFDTLARAYLAAGRPDQALEAATKACEMEPANPEFSRTRNDILVRR